MGEPARVEILLIEDNPADAGLFRRLLNGRCNITVAATGPEAFDRLFQRGRFLRTPKPQLVVVDINIPMLSGFEILNILRGNSGLRSIPAMVWSGSDNEEDIARAYKAGAFAFVLKKSGLPEMEATVSAFASFWCTQVLYPCLNQARTVEQGTQ